jgi:hypothetical protein
MMPPSLASPSTFIVFFFSISMEPVCSISRGVGAGNFDAKVAKFRRDILRDLKYHVNVQPYTD